MRLYRFVSPKCLPLLKRRTLRFAQDTLCCNKKTLIPFLQLVLPKTQLTF